MTKRIDLPIGLADSELLEYSRTGNEVTVQVRTWNDKKLVLRFTETIGVLDLLAGDFSELLQDHAETTDFLARALRNTYEVVPQEHPYHTYAFTNLDGDPSLIIVAENYQLAPVETQQQ